MRVTTAVSTETAAEDSAQHPDCPGSWPSQVGAVDLPWPVTLETNCGPFTVFSNGQVAASPPPLQPLWPLRATAGPGAWAEIRDGRLVLVRYGEIVWRSSRIYDPQSLGSALLGPGWLAFSIYSENGGVSDLYVASLDGPERRIGANEEPLAVAATREFLTSRWRSDGSDPDLVLLRADGTLVRVVAARVRFMSVDNPAHTMLFVRGGALWRTDGIRSWVVMTRRALGLRRATSFDRMDDGRILVTDPDRVLVLDEHGSVVAGATLSPLPRGGWGYVGAWQDGQNVDPRSGAMVVTQVWWRDSAMGGGPGWEGVYVLDRGASRARLVYGRRLRIAVCAHGSGVSWHGSWILYFACEGRAVAIDLTGRHDPIDLSGLARRLPQPADERQYGLAGAEWASFRSPAQMAAQPHLG